MVKIRLITLDLTDGFGGKLTFGLLLKLAKGDDLPSTEAEKQLLNQFAQIQGVLKKISEQAMAFVTQAAHGPRRFTGMYATNAQPISPTSPLKICLA